MSEHCNSVINAAGNFFLQLGIPESATYDDVRRAYKQRSLQIHPDCCKNERAKRASRPSSTLTKS